MKMLNITNGDAFNRYLLSKIGGEAVPFREAMMDGQAVFEVYSDEFIEVRAKEHCVSVEEYKSKMLPNDICEYSKLNLWFGKDTFCQMNVLTLLAYLEQIEYSGEVALNYIDDETFEVIDSDLQVELSGYANLYNEILIKKSKPNDVGVLDLNAIDLYFDYHSCEGALAKIVRENSEREDVEIIRILLEKSKEYGLSDIQAAKLIKKYK